MGNGNITQKDIAEKLGVSINTVSRALRDSEEISVPLRARIKELASEMGYIPNRVAYFMRGGKTNFVGIVVNSITNPYYTLCLNELISALGKKGYAPFIVMSKKNVLDFDTLTSLIMNHVCSILSFADIEDNVRQYCKENGIPLLLVGVPPQGENIDAIFADELYTGKVIAEEFFRSGRKHPCYIGTDVKQSSDLRKTEFIRLLTAKGYPVGEHMVIFKEREAQKEALEHAILSAKYDFFYCFNDEIASYVSEILEENAIKDYTLYGVDGTPKYLPICRKFNSIGYSFRRIAELVMQVLLKKLDGDTKYYQIKYEPYLIYSKEERK